MSIESMRSVAAVVALAACLHAGLWANFQTTGIAPNVNKSLASVSYSVFEGVRNFNDPPIATATQIRADLKAIAPYTDTIRTYRSTRGMELVPAIAAELGLKVTLGISLESNLDHDGNYDLVPDTDDPGNPDKRITRNEAEIRTAIKLARSYNNVNAIVVGNETTLTRSQVAAAQAGEAQKAYDKRDSEGQRIYPDFKSALASVRNTWDEALRIKNCSHVRFPRHRLSKMRQACNTPLWKRVETRRGVHRVAQRLYCYHSLTAQLKEKLRRSDFDKWVRTPPWMHQTSLPGVLSDWWCGTLFTSFNAKYNQFFKKSYHVAWLLNVDWMCPWKRSSAIAIRRTFSPSSC